MRYKNKVNKSPIKLFSTIRYTAKLLEFISFTLAARFAIKIFTTPIRFRLPKREEKMYKESNQHMLLIPELNKKINIYKLGNGFKKVLLVHGWSGRGTQMHHIAETLEKKGYSIISFDAPAHGKSEGKQSEMTQFITCILYLNKKYGPFEYAVGHSLGAMSILNSVKRWLPVKRIVIIGSGDIIKDIMYDFIKKLGMSIATAEAMIKLFEKRTGQTINNYSAYIAAQHINVPVLILHDENDTEINIEAAVNIKKHLLNGELIITSGLGHRKILGDIKVMQKIVEFLD